MQISQTISLDFGRDTLPITVFAKQYDKNTRYINITPLNCGQTYTLESGITARLQLTKPDGYTVINNATITNNIITAELTAQVLAAEGTAVAEIGLYKGTALLSSQIFYIDIKKAAYDSEAVESTSELNALVEALTSVEEAIDDAEEATEAANTAATSATTAAGTANTAAGTANAAAGTANTAATNAEEAAEEATEAATSATTAAGTANTAASAANTAAGTANTAASAANTAATGAEKVNISATSTTTGADITVTNRNGVSTTVHIDTLVAVNTWEDIKNAVRLGLGENLFPVGYEFTTLDSNTNKNITWVVRGHDHHTAANGKLTHTMTLETKYVYSGSSGSYVSFVFDASEALYYAESGLSAGTYNFTVANQAWYTADNGKTFQFTLTQAVPAGGQLVLNMTYNATLAGETVKTYASATSTTVIETATLAEGSGGTSLGTTDGTGNMNYMHRIIFGSNNYAQSAARQWLNSSAAAGSVWAPTNKFDRAPSWATSQKGFMNGLPSDFLAVVQAAVIPCRTNSVFEVNSLDGTAFTINSTYNLNDKFFLLSRPEIFGGWDSSSYKDGTQLDYYEGLSATECIKRDAAGSARYCWLRSPYPGSAGHERVVGTDGSLGRNGAYYAYGVAPACIIA